MSSDKRLEDNVNWGEGDRSFKSFGADFYIVNEISNTRRYDNEERKEILSKEKINGAIKFRNNKKKTNLKLATKGFVFVLIASLSGGVTATLLVNNKLNSIVPINESPGTIYVHEPYYVTNVGIPKNNVSKVAEVVGPTVVGISNSVDSFFESGVGKFSGSGIIFSSSGHIVTNYHVIEGAEKIMVKLASNTVDPFEAKLVGYDKISDIAVIKIETQGLTVAKFGDSSRVRVGDEAIAIGNPLGQEFAGSVTAGIISANNRRIKAVNSETGEEIIYKVLQTDAAINPGSSGGPLCNEAGEVVGMVSLNMKQQNVEGMGFAICIDEVKNVIQQIMEHGEVKRPDFGIKGGTAEYEGSSGVNGVYVAQVYTGSGAEAAGIKPMDIVIGLKGEEINNMDEFMSIVEKSAIGEIVSCKVWRNGTTLDLSVKITQKP